MKLKHLILIALILGLAITVIIGWNPLKAAITVLNIQRDTLTNGLVGYWTFDGPDTNWGTNIVTSRTASSHDGRLIGMSTTTTPKPGVIGQSLDFDGVDAHIDEQSGNVGDVRSVAFWINLDDVSAYQTIFRFSSAASTSVSNGSITSDATGAVIYVDRAVASAVATSTWHHIVVTSDVVAASDIFIGSNSVSSFLNGRLDELRLYNRALSVKEIEELYRRAAPERRPRASTNPRTDLIPNGLVGYWAFDGPDITWSNSVSSTVADLSGNSHTGEVKLGTVLSAGAMGQGLKFDGVEDDYVAVDSTDALKFLDDTITFAAWIKPTSIATGNKNIFTKMFTQNNQIQYGFFLSDDEIAFYYTSASDVQHKYSSDAANLRTNNWYHVAITYTYGTGSSAKTYINGVEFSGTWTSGTGNNIARTNTRELWIGRMEHWNFPNLFSGVIDEVRIYDRILSAKEIEELYRSGKR